jgi:hypothetical protein
MGPIERASLCIQTPATTPKRFIKTTLFGGLCCVGFINPIGVAAGGRDYPFLLGPSE